MIFRVRIYTEEAGPFRLFRVLKIVDSLTDFKGAREAAREILNMGPTIRIDVKAFFWWHPVTNLDAFMRMHDPRAFYCRLYRWRLPRR